jgi:hypothetical protein
MISEWWCELPSMKPRTVALFITIDLVTLLIVLLVLSYYGMSHLFLLLLGIVILILAIYDLQSGLLSALFSDFLGIENPSELGRFRWLPVILAALLLLLSLPVVFKHGFTNEAQRWAMQHGQFIRVALPAIVGGLAIIAIAVGTILSGSKNKK